MAGELLRTRIVKRADTAPYLALLEALIRLAVALAALRQAQQQMAQAEAAAHAAEQLLAEHRRRAAAATELIAALQQHAPTVTPPTAYRPPAQTPRRSTSR